MLWKRIILFTTSPLYQFLTHDILLLDLFHCILENCSLTEWIAVLPQLLHKLAHALYK